MEQNTAFNWDSTISNQEEERGFEPLPEGDYEFSIHSITKKQFNGSAKMPACPQASVEIYVFEPKTGREIPIYSNLFLCSSQEWKLAQFFKCIGVMEPDAKGLKMRWDIEGEIGKCHIGPREYNGKKYNEVKKWLVPEKKEKPKKVRTDDLPF